MQGAVSVVRCTSLSQKAAMQLQQLQSLGSVCGRDRTPPPSTQARFLWLTTLTTTASFFTVFLSAGKRTGQHCRLLDAAQPKVPPHSGIP